MVLIHARGSLSQVKPRPAGSLGVESLLVLHGYQVLVGDDCALAPRNTCSDQGSRGGPITLLPTPPLFLQSTCPNQRILSPLSKVTLAGDFGGNFWMK